jgi:hypothetical protein
MVDAGAEAEAAFREAIRLDPARVSASAASPRSSGHGSDGPGSRTCRPDAACVLDAAFERARAMTSPGFADQPS